jgi:hypothetical protein
MSDFSIFMAGSADKTETVKYAASTRFVENGKPVEWELKAIDSDLDEAIRKDCTKKVPSGKRGQFTQELDTDKYIGKMCVACTVYPDLNNAELQDSYKVKSADALLKRMLLPGEYTDYKSKVMEVNGYDMSMEELVDEAKN